MKLKELDKIVTIQCPNKKCNSYDFPIFEQNKDERYVTVLCAKCHGFIRLASIERVPDDAIIQPENSWWKKLKIAESELRPAYILQQELSKLKLDYAKLQERNIFLEDMLENVKETLTEALEREGIMEYVPKWLKD